MLTEILKKKTAASHQELEKRLVQKIKTIHNTAGYIGFLQLFYRYFGSLENKAAPYISAHLIPDIHQRRHAKRIADDISILGGTPIESNEEIRLPHVDSWQEALGAFYVMEGSTLGGQIIVQQISKRTQINKGFSFFSGYGEHTLAYWAKFQERINAQVVQPTDIERTVRTAEQTFTYFTTFIKQYG